ncbi:MULTISPECIES: Imm49 family immunity protein [Rodentibacter]|uniref:Imm49 family immunity protein n=1 Tax=Rodentibacter TaxID=1960084 RepID=UPI001CFC5A0B|nr:Imm49 family immunity protein [Rodentibacter sp. JRC1]GJI55702.1 hypothetical protein HEMROJRC1_08140 [Rodentibacter sp. JRC1]
MSKNYSVYLISSAKRNYQESVEHVKNSANYLKGIGYCDLYDYDFKRNIAMPRKVAKNTLKEQLNIIHTGLGNPFACMTGIANYYVAQSSLNLLLNSDINSFKYNAYIASKLYILGSEEYNAWIWGYNTSCFFTPIMSDSPELLTYLKKCKDSYRADILYEKKDTDTYSFFLRNTLLALAGDWELLKERALLFLNDPKKQKADEKRIPDHEFYVGLCNQSIDEMRTALNKLLEPKLARRAVYDNNVWFDFYLQMQVVMYAKIAAIHGFDLGIDSPIAPKELIEYKPLDKYEDPYDFMKEYDFSRPHQEWIDMWHERMRIAKEQEEKTKKKGFFSWFKR